MPKLSPAQVEDVLAISAWMLGEARLAADADLAVGALAERLGRAGVPLDRFASMVRLLHAENAASARIWERGKGVRSFIFPFNPEVEEGYRRSPAAEAHRTREWVEIRIPETPDEAYNVVAELRAAGIVHYLCAPVFMVNGMANILSFATCAAAGFTPRDIAFLRAVFPAIAACQEILAMHRIVDEVMRMYVGDEPHRRILSGDVHRGEVTRIRSAIFIADMRDFTVLTASMTAEEATALLNAYYDCVVPAVEAAGGEVLKFIGDAILAIFRAEEDPQAVCASALAAACRSLDAVAARTGAPRFEIGIAVHFGTTGFGNVGSGARLDYTIIGRDVNLTSRIALLCAALGEPLLVSGTFAANCPGTAFRSLGHRAVKGIAVAQEVLAPERG